MKTNHCSGEPAFCFKAGDARVNEQVGLSAMHNFWVQLHNFITDGLHAINPNWDDEILYQVNYSCCETRTVVSTLEVEILEKRFA